MFKNYTEFISESYTMPDEIKKLVTDNPVVIPELKIFSTTKKVGADVSWDFANNFAKKFGDNWRLPTVEEMIALDKKGLLISNLQYWTSSDSEDEEYSYHAFVYRSSRTPGSSKLLYSKNYKYHIMLVRNFTLEELHKYRGRIGGSKYGF